MIDESKQEILKINSFHFIRLICSIIVIYEHVVVLSNLNILCLNIRDLAVEIFFILSGFWVTSSYLRSSNVKEFFKKRIKKIFPLYWTVVISTSILLYFISSLSFKEYFFNFNFYKYLLANLSTMNFLHPNLPGVFDGLAFNGAVNGSLWTIKVEIGFYFCLPIIMMLFKRIKANNSHGIEWVLFILLYILSVVYSIVCNFIVTNLGEMSSFTNQLPAFISYFVCGIVFYIFWSKIAKKINFAILPALFW